MNVNLDYAIKDNNHDLPRDKIIPITISWKE